MYSRMMFLGLVVFAACKPTPNPVDPADEEFNVTVAPPQTNSIIDSVSHFMRTNPTVPIDGPFKMEVRGCQRFNVHYTDHSWAAGMNCQDPPNPTAPVRPMRVKGPDGERVPLRACCPHNQPCNKRGNNDGGADFLIAVGQNGILVTTVEEYGKLCGMDEVQGAIDLPDRAFSRYTYPPF